MQSGHPFLARGFRPFFLCGALYAAVGIILWVLHQQNILAPTVPWDDLMLWHGHEMIYGFVMAIVSGFLLTAVANWTSSVPVRRFHLASLCFLWLAGRIAMNTQGLIPSWLIITLDTALIPALAISLSFPLLRSRNKRNFIFLGMLMALFVCNLFIHFGESLNALYIALFLILMMISLIGGRIIPSFTVAALRQRGMNLFQTDQIPADLLALLSLILIMVSILSEGLSSWPTGVLSLFSAGIHVWRMRVWHTKHTLNDPLLWILHVGYGWLVAGLVLTALAGFGFLPVFSALHALTVGAIGSMTIGMMCRVAQGHTGRLLVAGKIATACFILMQMAAVIRVLGPVLFPAFSSLWISLSGLLWSGIFLTYAVVYFPILWGPRPDGRPA
ncbi:MAG: NnrS family protein [Rhodospirillales bacterium]|nr:NnrS family protein [Rhodospirillales bacterium]